MFSRDSLKFLSKFLQELLREFIQVANVITIVQGFLKSHFYFSKVFWISLKLIVFGRVRSEFPLGVISTISVEVLYFFLIKTNELQRYFFSNFLRQFLLKIFRFFFYSFGTFLFLILFGYFIRGLLRNSIGNYFVSFSSHFFSNFLWKFLSVITLRIHRQLLWKLCQ